MKRHPFLAAFAVFVALRVLGSPLIGATTCRDGWASMSIGSRGACSWHGGVGTNWSAVLVTLLAAAGAIAVFNVLASRNDKEAAQTRAALDRERAARDEKIKADAAAAGIACPTCGHPLLLRTARRGPGAGRQFWGCSRYPACKATKPYTS